MRALVLGLLLVATGARARERLSGTVRDAETGQPLADVVVTVTSPSLQEEVYVLSDVQGVYHFEALPEGLYTLSFDIQAFRPLRRTEVALTSGAPTTLDVELQSSPLDTELGDDGPPLIDVGSTEVAWSDGARRDVFHRLPVNPALARGGRVRSFDSLVGLAPGVQDEPLGVSIRGASPFENRYVLDGLSLQDPLLGLNPVPLSGELLQTPPLIVSGGEPATWSNGLGGLVELTLPTQDDALRGSVFGAWASGGRLTQLDAGATLGGTLVKERLWFFAGAVPALGWVSSPDGVLTQAPLAQAVARVTYSPHEKHLLSLSLITTPSEADALALGAPGGRTTLSFLNYEGVALRGHLLVDASLGWTWQNAWRLVGGLRRQQAALRTTWLTPWSNIILQGGASVDRTLTEAFASTRVGGFLHASVPFVSWVTVNAGARYDVQSVDPLARAESFQVGHGLSPRVGLVVDPWRHGGTRFFAHYANHQGPLLLGLLASLPPSGFIDPGIRAPSSDEFLVGAEHALLGLSRVGLSASRHRLDTDIAHVRGPDGFVMLGNPGRGQARNVSVAARAQDAVTVWLDRLRFEGLPRWMLRASYTWARLSGNDPGPFVLSEAGAGGLAPRLVSDTLPGDATGLLPLDRTHTVRLLAAREFPLSARWSTSLGLAYQGRSGTPLDLSGGERTPWEHDVDARWVVAYARPSRAALSLSLEVYNLLGLEDTRARAPRQGRLGVRYDF